MRRAWSVRAATVGVVMAATVAGPAGSAGGSGPAVGSTVRVAVSVATLWVSRASPRPVDRPALQNPARIRQWLHDMSTEARRGLVGRVETQALYGERLRVTGVDGSWLHVVALRQPTSRDSRGYPGWVPVRQVTSATSGTGSRVATVLALTTRLHPTDAGAGLTVSFGTRLPVLGVTADRVSVRTLDGRRMTVAAGDVVVSDGPDALPATRAGLMATALSFRGVPYLWGGRSGYAVDCSGFTELVYDVHGVRLPRDANDQYAAGRSVPAASVQRADLAFFQRGDTIGHVGFVTGKGRLLHAPGSGMVVRVDPIGSVSGFAGYRSFLPA